MNKERLLKLADHLEFGILGHRIFDFTKLNDGDLISKDTMCRTNGCALGECPIAFPEDWVFHMLGIYSSEFVPILRGYNSTNPSISPSFASAQKFFDITDAESELLFMPSDYESEEERDDENSGDWNDIETLTIKMKRISRQFKGATKENVAHQIRRFVELMEL